MKSKKTQLKELEEELEGLKQFMDLCPYGVKDIMRRDYLEDEVWRLSLELFHEEDSEEESEQSEGEE